MKKLALLIILFIILVGCSPSDQKILEAIGLTEAAKPTDTSTPLPIITETSMPTITLIPTTTTSPTPDIQHIKGLSHEDVLFMFTRNGFTCGEWEIDDEGNYEQSCLSPALIGVPDSTIMAKIAGKSEDTVFGYFIVFTPHKTFDSWDDLEKLLKNSVDFGQEPEENIAWIDDVFIQMKNAEDITDVREYFNTDIMIASESGVVSLIVVIKR